MMNGETGWNSSIFNLYMYKLAEDKGGNVQGKIHGTEYNQTA